MSILRGRYAQLPWWDLTEQEQPSRSPLTEDFFCDNDLLIALNHTLWYKHVSYVSRGQGLPSCARPMKVTYMQGQKISLLQIFPPEYVSGYGIFSL